MERISSAWPISSKAAPDGTGRAGLPEPACDRAPDVLPKLLYVPTRANDRVCRAGQRLAREVIRQAYGIFLPRPSPARPEIAPLDLQRRDQDHVPDCR